MVRPTVVMDSSDEEEKDHDSEFHSNVSRRNVVVISSDEEEDETFERRVRQRRAAPLSSDEEEEEEEEEEENEEEENEVNDGMPFTLDQIIARVEAHPDVEGAWVTSWNGQTDYLISSVCEENDNNFERNLVPLVVELTNEETEFKNGRLCVKNMNIEHDHMYTTKGIPHPRSDMKWVYKCCCHMEELSYLHGVRHVSSGVVFLVGNVCLENFGKTKYEVNAYIRWAKKKTGGHRILPLELRDFARLQSCPVPKPRACTAPITIRARFPRRAFHWLKNWKLEDVKAMRPCEAKWAEKDQKDLLHGIRRVTSQPFETDGDFVIVRETYAPSNNGFPGRLYSSSGCQGVCRPVRANLLSETADMDMSMAMPRILLWVCHNFDIPAPHLEHFVSHRDGPNGILQQLMHDMNVTKAKAKQLTNIPWTMGEPMRTHNKYMQDVDKEAKSVQQALMARPELRWILDYCKTNNRPGSFIAHLFQWVECKLLLRVYQMMVDELRIPVTALVFDGLNLGDKSKHGDEAILGCAHAACEEVCPGINMIWAWKELDFTVESVDKLQKIKNEDGSVKELRVPAAYKTQEPKRVEQTVQKKAPLATIASVSAPRKPSAWDRLKDAKKSSKT